MTPKAIQPGDKVTLEPPMWFDGTPVANWGRDPLTVRRTIVSYGVPCAYVSRDGEKPRIESIDRLYLIKGPCRTCGADGTVSPPGDVGMIYCQQHAQRATLQPEATP